MILAKPAAPRAWPHPLPGGSMFFVENAGQWPEAARFQVWGLLAGLAHMADRGYDLDHVVDAPPRIPRADDILPSPLSFEEREGAWGEGRRFTASTSSSPSPAPTRTCASSRSTH